MRPRRRQVYFATANDWKLSEAHLEFLHQELRQIVSLFATVSESVTFTTNFKATPQSLKRDLVRSNSRYDIFHYAGHSRPGVIALLDSEAGVTLRNYDAVNFADLLGRMRAFRLVFLNSCESISIARYLTSDKVGIPCAIGTTSLLEDHHGMHFAYLFYAQLCICGTTISSAFDRAKREFIRHYGEKVLFPYELVISDQIFTRNVPRDWKFIPKQRRPPRTDSNITISLSD